MYKHYKSLIYSTMNQSQNAKKCEFREMLSLLHYIKIQSLLESFSVTIKDRTISFFAQRIGDHLLFILKNHICIYMECNLSLSYDHYYS
jgi:hypothetical protein